MKKTYYFHNLLYFEWGLMNYGLGVAFVLHFNKSSIFSGVAKFVLKYFCSTHCNNLHVHLICENYPTQNF